MKCGRCGKQHDGGFGSGRFCNKKCASARDHSELTKERIRKSLVQYCEDNPKPKPKYTCEKCGIEFEGYIPSCRKKYCKKCIRKRPHTKECRNLLEYSKRTVGKILKRAKKGCSICKWNKAACDLHHIKHKSKGGSDNHDNLIIVCPNCHREIHEGTCAISNEELTEISIAHVFKDWKSYYNPQ